MNRGPDAGRGEVRMKRGFSKPSWISRLTAHIASRLPANRRLRIERDEPGVGLIAPGREADELQNNTAPSSGPSCNQAALSEASPTQAEFEMNPAADRFIMTPPHIANGIRLFGDDWISDVPGYGIGKIPLFDDHRVHWFENQAGGLRGKSALELGPLEGGHSYMLWRAGARPIVSIEANARAFMKCLVVKNALAIEADFMLGDFSSFVAQTDRAFDFVLACGVLYHMLDPISLLQGCCRIAGQIGLWTHYFDEHLVPRNPALAPKFSGLTTNVEHRGREFRLHEHLYAGDLRLPNFCGGTGTRSFWMEKDDILWLLELNGFRITLGEDNEAHPNGPSLLLFAERRR